ncbi:glycosyltransferase family 1 protein [Cedecea colo]|uniref:Glycosyltransferase n=1 Tax=Cedecea colo TaxID=2552946 RepID=A0ABX0VGP6_9ENTR|nr:glycosyltransferase family 1 protein [Cedecea colo]NIY46202.1 hypothetical protein [Cedecea colo]
MTVINFIFPKHENLPEIKHYIDYFSKIGINCYCNSKSIAFIRNEALVYIEWHIMGTHFLHQPKFLNKIDGKCFLIHEYASLSTGKNKLIKLIKDLIKHKCSHKPDHQLFLNGYIQKRMAIRGVYGELRDMGVSNIFIKSRNKVNNALLETYDFAYVGSMAAERKIENFLDCDLFNEKKILMLGNPPSYLKKRYEKKSNINFIGRVEQDDIPYHLAQVRVCINYIPDEYPYNQQTSTKLIEYLTLGKDVISNKYEWVFKFLNDNKIAYEDIDNEFIFIKNNDKYVSLEWSVIISNLKITNLIKNNESF